MAKCTYCEAWIPEGARFCPKCRAMVPPTYDDKGWSNFSGTYGHTDCWEMDASNYQVNYIPLHSDTAADKQSAAWNYNASDPVHQRRPKPFVTSEIFTAKKPPRTWDDHKKLRTISYIVLIFTWILNPIAAFSLVLNIIGTVLDRTGRSGKPLYIVSIVTSTVIAGFVLLAAFLSVNYSYL